MKTLGLFRKLGSVSLFVLIIVAPGCGQTAGSPVTRAGNDADDFNGERHSAEVQGQGKALVTRCESQVSAGANCKVVVGFQDAACVASPPLDLYGYSLAREADGFHVGLRIHLTMLGVADARADVILGKVLSCVPKIAGVWLRYGIHLNLNIQRDVNEGHYAAPETAVRLVDRSGRSNAANYFFTDATENEVDVFCKVLLHETGHILGLPDEYRDINAPERKFVSTEKRPWSVMADNYHHWEVLDFYPRHVRAVLAPLCHLN